MIGIEEIQEGTGDLVRDGHTLDVRYKGSFPDGKMFDSGTFSFRVGSGQVIQGFDLGVQGMKVGGKRRVTIPPHLGYGERGAGNVIPPNSTLVFELEVLAAK
jgi:FKBP-type peptidyl-prolyl cis-trans isomerase